MSEIVCRRRGCTETLSDEDDNKGYEHCSPACIEACDDLDDVELRNKQDDHDADAGDEE